MILKVETFLVECVLFAGTDDDLPPSHRVVPRGGSSVSTNGRPSTLPPSHMYDQVAADMEAQIHHVEKEAYFSLLRAFRAQADAITWVFFVESRSLLILLVEMTISYCTVQEKDGLITEMRKELRVSHEEHRELLARVNADDTIRRIRREAFLSLYSVEE